LNDIARCFQYNQARNQAGPTYRAKILNRLSVPSTAQSTCASPRSVRPHL